MSAFQERDSFSLFENFCNFLIFHVCIQKTESDTDISQWPAWMKPLKIQQEMYNGGSKARKERLRMKRRQVTTGEPVLSLRRNL